MQDLSQDLRAWFKSQITDGGDGGSAIPTEWDNSPSEATRNVLYARFLFTPTARIRRTIGSTLEHRRRGLCLVQLRAPGKTGDLHLQTLSQRVEVAMSSKTVGDVTLETAFTTVIGTQGGWWRYDVTCPWFSDA